jgi:hypothetical protein
MTKAIKRSMSIVIAIAMMLVYSVTANAEDEYCGFYAFYGGSYQPAPYGMDTGCIEDFEYDGGDLDLDLQDFSFGGSTGYITSMKLGGLNGTELCDDYDLEGVPATASLDFDANDIIVPGTSVNGVYVYLTFGGSGMPTNMYAYLVYTA